MKKIYKLILIVCLVSFVNTGCEDFLEQKPDNILTNENVFKDWNMIQSVLANYYGRVKWGQRIDDDFQYVYLDEACNSSGGPDNTNGFSDTQWRVFDYGLIRNINQFLEGVRSDAASGLNLEQKNQIEGEARFLTGLDLFQHGQDHGGNAHCRR